MKQRRHGQSTMSKIVVSEIFGITIQGEGALTGRPTVFVRTGACDYRCHWCDTLYAVLPEHRNEWQSMTTEEVFTKIQRCSPSSILVTLSGGNPAIQPLGDLISLGHAHGYTFALETQGSIFQHWMKKLDFLILSPKPPSSRMETKWGQLERCLNVPTTIYFKVVIFDEKDYTYAQEVHSRYPDVPMYLQVGNPNPPQVGEFDMQRVLEKMRWLVEKVTQDHWNDVVILPQLHTFLWGNKQGV